VLRSASCFGVSSYKIHKLITICGWRIRRRSCPYPLARRVLRGTFKGWVKVQFNLQNSQNFSICRTHKNSPSTRKDYSRSANNLTMAVTLFPVGTNTLKCCEISIVVLFFKKIWIFVYPCNRHHNLTLGWF